MGNFINKIKLYIVAHKIISIIVLIVVIFGGRFIFAKLTSTSGDTRYVIGKVELGTIIASVSGTGQVSADSQIDLKPKASGDVVYLGAKNGDRVSAGALIAKLDTGDAEKAVRDAEASLQSTKLSLQKLKIQNSEENMTADLLKAYADGWSAVSNAFLDLPSIVGGLDDLLGQTNLSDNAARMASRTAQDYKSKAEVSYFAAKKAYEQNRKSYVVLNTDSSKSDIENIIKETGQTAKLLSDAIKDMLSFVNYMADYTTSSSEFTASQNTLATYSDTIASHFTNLTAAATNINNNKDSSQNADLDLASAKLSVTQKENALSDAKDKLADYFIRAPYAGTIANMNIKKSDSASASTIIATLITDKQIAEISMNEVDVAKIKIGEKATLTFDAVPDLIISGVVEEIDPLGTVSQGVVTYNVKVALDTQDVRVKPAMSVSAAIITDMKGGVLVVPNSAVKSQNGRSYVEAFEAPLSDATNSFTSFASKVAPKRIPIEVGLVSDSQTEIISGVSEGDKIVVRTILPTSGTATTAPSIFGSPANRTGGNTGNNAVRIPAER